MGLSSALNTALNGLALNGTTIDVVGNNIANSGTNGFKASTVRFLTQLSRTLSVGSRPSASSGGTDPRQIGLGALTASINKDFTQGSITNSTSPSDLAIQGDGFFIVKGTTGSVYTRDGSFALNSPSLLTTSQGLRAQGYAVDANFNLVTTQLNDIRIPLGDLNVAQETRDVALGGALFATGAMGTNGSHFLSDALSDAGNADAAVTASTLLSDVHHGGSSVFTAGQTLEFRTRKGQRLLDPLTFTITAASTMQDLLSLMDRTIGIHSDGTVPNGVTGGRPGVSINAAGQIEIVGNAGTVNSIDMSFGDLISNGSPVNIGFVKQSAANGESAITDFVVFDSLGTAITLKMTASLESRTANSTTFRWFLDSAQNGQRGGAVATGTITFDGNGHVTAGGTATFTLQRDGTAASHMQITADFSQVSGISSTRAGSTLSLVSQDGSDPGTLTNFVALPFLGAELVVLRASGFSRCRDGL